MEFIDHTVSTVFPVAQGSDAVIRGSGTITCVDINQIEYGNSSNNATACASLEAVTEESTTIKEGNSHLHACFLPVRISES